MGMSWRGSVFKSAAVGMGISTVMGISLGLELSCEMGDIRESRFISVSGDLLAVDFIVTVLDSVRVSRELGRTACPPFDFGVNMW